MFTKSEAGRDGSFFQEDHDVIDAVLNDLEHKRGTSHPHIMNDPVYRTLSCTHCDNGTSGLQNFTSITLSTHLILILKVPTPSH